MANNTKGEPKPIKQITIPGLGAVPVVAIRTPGGQVALRHPDELTVPATPATKTGGEK